MSDSIITIQVDKDYGRNRGMSFKRFQNERKFWDCKVIGGTKTLYCHSILVCALSPALEEMIETKIRGGLEKVVTFEDVQPEVIRKILNYMYTGSVNIPQELVLKVVQVCDELMIEDLKERCLYRVPDILSPQTAMGWMRYAHKHELSSIFHSCKRYVSESFLEVSKEKEFIRLSLNDLSITLQLLNDAVSPDNLLTSVLSWINYDKESRKKALDYTSGYLKLKYCKKQFLVESTKQYIDIFRSNPEFNSRVAHMLHPKKLSLVVIGGFSNKGKHAISNQRGWKLESETKFVEITGLPCDLLHEAPSICQYGWNKLILTGGLKKVCTVFEMPTKKWKRIRDLKTKKAFHASMCVQQELLIFGGRMFRTDSPDWTDCVELLNIEQVHGEWQQAPPMPSILTVPKVAKMGTVVFLMGENNPVLYLFDVVRKVWSQKASMPQNPREHFSIAAGNDNLYATGGSMDTCWKYNFSTDTWTKLSSPAFRHASGALIFHQDLLLFLGGYREDIQGYDIASDTWVIAPYKLPEDLAEHHAFMMDLGE